MNTETNTPQDDQDQIKNPRLRMTNRGKTLAKAAIVTGVAAAVLVPISSAVEAAQRILAPEPSATAEAAAQPIAQQEIAALIDTARSETDPHVQYGNDIVVTGPNTSLYDDALAQISPELLIGNESNIKSVLLESTKTANTDQPDTPYITQPEQVYALTETDINHDGKDEFVVSLKSDNASQNPQQQIGAPSVVEANGTIPAPITH